MVNENGGGGSGGGGEGADDDGSAIRPGRPGTTTDGNGNGVHSSNDSNGRRAGDEACRDGDDDGAGSADVYVIPDYPQNQHQHPQQQQQRQQQPQRPQILVLPYVPFPSALVGTTAAAAAAAVSPNNNSNNTAQTHPDNAVAHPHPHPPYYSHHPDPPPEYNSWVGGGAGGVYAGGSNPTPLLPGPPLRRPASSGNGGSHCTCCNQETHLPNTYVSGEVYIYVAMEKSDGFGIDI